MKLSLGVIRDARYLEHKTGHIHPEHPKRLEAVYRMLDSDFAGGLLEIHPEMATMEELELVHTPAHIQKILTTADHDYTSLAPDTPASSRTYLASWLAVGGCLRGLEALRAGECDVCFALVRPPGHHALSNRVAGFCIFNNLAICARFARDRYGFSRILIIDWDIHHGNGLNDLFYEDKEVLYFSTHDVALFPYTGDWEDAGKGSGEGYTINVPIPRTLEDGEFLHLYLELLGPVVKRYRPQLVLVAAGFDAHAEDPLGHSNLSENVFHRLATLLTELRENADHPPTLLALEGGYKPSALARCVKAVLEGFSGGRKAKDSDVGGTDQSRGLVQRAKKLHRRYGVWVD